MFQIESLVSEYSQDLVRPLNQDERKFIGDWVMMSVRFSHAIVTPCVEIWEDCLITKDGEIVMKRCGQKINDTIKIDVSDGSKIISIRKEMSGSFVYYGELVD